MLCYATVKKLFDFTNINMNTIKTEMKRPDQDGVTYTSAVYITPFHVAFEREKSLKVDENLMEPTLH